MAKHRRKRVFIAFSSLVLAAVACGIVLAQDGQTLAEARQLYNDGSGKLRAGKFREAESFLQNAVASQNVKIQSPALYNLGWVRFQEGVKELEDKDKQPRSAPSPERAMFSGDGAIHAADDALASDDLGAIIAAYQRGRGARKELKAAEKAVRQAMESNGSVLAKWERSSGDFKSALELKPKDTDARTNADLVDRYIARLIDQQQMMMKSNMGMEQKKQDLEKKMAQLKGKLPEGMEMPGGKDDDDEEGEDGKKQREPKPGESEGPIKEGKEQSLGPEDAERLLGMLRLDANRKLPIGADDTATPKERKGRNW